MMVPKPPALPGAGLLPGHLVKSLLLIPNSLAACSGLSLCSLSLPLPTTGEFLMLLTRNKAEFLFCFESISQKKNKTKLTSHVCVCRSVCVCV